eukprot:scaffold3290_cov259-Pinguiococcus_pyrenoidosus.AAC.6
MRLVRPKLRAGCACRRPSRAWARSNRAYTAPAGAPRILFRPFLPSEAQAQALQCAAGTSALWSVTSQSFYQQMLHALPLQDRSASSSRSTTSRTTMVRPLCVCECTSWILPSDETRRLRKTHRFAPGQLTRPASHVTCRAVETSCHCVRRLDGGRGERGQRRGRGEESKLVLGKGNVPIGAGVPATVIAAARERGSEARMLLTTSTAPYRPADSTAYADSSWLRSGWLRHSRFGRNFLRHPAPHPWEWLERLRPSASEGILCPPSRRTLPYECCCSPQLEMHSRPRA